MRRDSIIDDIDFDDIRTAQGIKAELKSMEITERWKPSYFKYSKDCESYHPGLKKLEGMLRDLELVGYECGTTRGKIVMIYLAKPVQYGVIKVVGFRSQKEYDDFINNTDEVGVILDSKSVLNRNLATIIKNPIFESEWDNIFKNTDE